MSSQFLFCFCTLLCSFGSSVAYADAPNAETSPSRVPLPLLHVIAGKDDKAQGNQGMFEFGTLSMVEPSDDLAGLDSRMLWKGLPLPGLKHVFTLQNQTKSPVVITGFEHQWLVLNAQLWQNGENVPVPFRLVPSQKIGVQVAFNYRVAGVANNVAWLVDVLGTDKKTPLATLTMAGSVESGIAFTEKELDFRRISKGTSPTKTFSIRFDKRVSDNIPPGPLKLLCKNPQIRILDAPSRTTVKGVKVEKDTIIFP